MAVPSEICLLNDSFPPLIDGVANTVVNYARVMTNDGQPLSVVVPKYPDADDSALPYPVIRYPSVDLRKQLGYTAGNPFDAETILALKKRNIGLVHSHCPCMSTLLAREIKGVMDVPFILTYHTRFEADISAITKVEMIQQTAIRALISNVSSCDELWTVSRGAGKSIQKLGYKGDFRVMPNGVDIPRGRATPDEVHMATGSYDLPEDVPLFLYVGRMKWYKGIRMILEALRALRSQDIPFRMVFVGSGTDYDQIRVLSSELRLDDCVFFTGAIHDRTVLRAWYTRGDFFLFPSTMDTNGLVVREAAACGLGSLLIRNSCAAEGTTHMHNTVLAEENSASIAVALMNLLRNPQQMRKIGENACDELYLSWDDAVHIATERYGEVMEEYQRNTIPHRKTFSDGLLDIYADMVNLFGQFEKIRKEV